jgi:hypothetical protein
MSPAPVLGNVLHWKKFEFEDGKKKDKYLVVIGAKKGCDYLFAVATSQRHRRAFKPGCHKKLSYYHIPGVGRDYFKKDTWLIFVKCVQQRQADTLKLISEGALSVEGSLRHDVVKAIQECLRQCDDVPAIHIALL